MRGSRLLVLGASGGVGRHLVAQAIARGHVVRVVVRSAADLPGAEVVRGEVLEPGVVREAVRGCDAVVSSLGIRRRSLFPYSALTSPPDFCSASARLVVDAMRAEGLRRIVAVSAAGVGDSAPGMNLVMRFLVGTSSIGVAYRDLAVMEGIYAESGLDWTAPRPVTLTNGPLTGRVVKVGHFGATASISRADVAHWVLDAVARPGDADRTPQIAAG